MNKKTEWICPDCGTKNNMDFCFMCGFKKPIEIKEDKSEKKITVNPEIKEEKHIKNKETVIPINENKKLDIPKKEEPKQQEVKINLMPSLNVDIAESKQSLAKQKIKEISINDKMEAALQPLSSPHVHGFRCCFLGDAGTSKEKAFSDVANLLYELKKTSQPDYIWCSFGDIPEKFDNDKLYIIDDLSSAIAHLFNLDDLSPSSTVEQERFKKLLNKLINSGKNTYIILNTNSAELKGFLPLDPKLSYVFTKKIEFPDLTNDEVCEKFISSLPEYHRSLVTQDFKTKFSAYLDRNRRYYPFNNLELAEFLAMQASLQPTLNIPEEKQKNNTLKDSFSNIVGMKIVKDQVHELNEYLVARAKLESIGAKLPSFNLHMMFLGNPGVGKTTIARILARLLFDLGYIRQNKLVEVSSKDLIGVHGNETGLKTNRVIMNALGGVLFVDEAYSLSQSCGQAGLEAIATLVKAMEDYKTDLVCMFAGYSKEMDDFTRSNSGIASRINYIFEFEDYTAEELYQIFEIKLHNAGLTISDSAKEQLFKVVKFGAGRRNFGNGRYVDKLLQRTLTKHALLNLSGKNMLILQKESIPTVEEIMKSFGRFSA